MKKAKTNESEIKIDRGIPLPKERGNMAKKYPLDTMKVGESFFVPAHENSVQNVRCRAHYARQASGLTRRFAVRSVTEGGVNGQWLSGLEGRVAMSNADITRKFHGGNPESNAAHRSIVNDKARQRALILTAFREDARRWEGPTGYTRDEMERYAHMTHQGCSPRFTELAADGVIYATDETRPTRSGRKARVYRLAP